MNELESYSDKELQVAIKDLKRKIEKHDSSICDSRLKIKELEQIRERVPKNIALCKNEIDCLQKRRKEIMEEVNAVSYALISALATMSVSDIAEFCKETGLYIRLVDSGRYCIFLGIEGLGLSVTITDHQWNGELEKYLATI